MIVVYFIALILYLAVAPFYYLAKLIEYLIKKL